MAAFVTLQDNHLLRRELANALGTIKDLQAKLASSNKYVVLYSTI